MKKTIVLISVFAVLMIAFSGCVDNTPAVNGTDSDNPETKAISNEDAAGISTLETLPAGFEYVGTLPLSTDEIKSDYNVENVSGILGGSEGLYKYTNASETTDLYIDAIELESAGEADNFVSIYMDSFRPLQSGSRFVEESFNGHSAVRITEYIRTGGADVPRYSYIWSNENYVLVVSGSTTDDTLIKQLAEATGY